MENWYAFVEPYLQDFYQHTFLQRMLFGTLLVSLACSLLSVYVVLKKMAFIGQGISHSAFGGIAFGLWLFPALASPNLTVFLITLGFCLFVALLIGFSTRTHQISEDSAIGIFFATSMALGVIFMSLRESYTTDVSHYLFGALMAISKLDLQLLSALAVLVLFSIVMFYKELYAFCYDESYADTLGIPTGFLHYWLLFLLALTIVLSAKMVGVILVTAFLVIPGTCAQLMTCRFNKMVFFSLFIGLITSAIGIVLSSQVLDLPPAALIVTLQFAFFLFLLLIHRFRQLIKKNP